MQTATVEETILRLQGAFDEAELHADVDTLRQLLTEDFLSIGPKGFILTKDEWIGRHVHFAYHALETSEIDIRCYDKAAIVRNIQKNRATYKDHPVELTLRVSQVWVDQEGQWQLAGIQFSPLDQSAG